MIEIPPGASTDLFAQDRPEGFRHLYPHPTGVRMCGDSYGTNAPDKWPIVAVRVTHDPEGAYFAWWSAEDQAMHFVYPNHVQVDICFPYGPAAEEKLDRGRRCRVRVERLG